MFKVRNSIKALQYRFDFSSSTIVYLLKMEDNCVRNAPLRIKEEIPFLKTATSILALILEVHLVLLYAIWETIVGIYRTIIPATEKSIKGEIVLITGSGHGLGRELALLYAAEGATVICVDRSERNNEETIKMIDKLGYTKAHAYTCDVTDYKKVTEFCTKIEKDIGDVTILINNAGIMPSKPFLQQSREDIERTMNINVMSHFWILQAILPTMLKNNYGHIVAVSSLCAVEGMVNLIPYSTSKFAVRGLMSSLLKELEQDDKCEIKTTTVYPYIIDTGLVKNVTIRFPFLTPVLKKEDLAKFIVSAQRRNVVEATVPTYLYYLFSLLTCLPHKVGKLFTDFMNIKVNPDN